MHFAYKGGVQRLIMVVWQQHTEALHGNTYLLFVVWVLYTIPFTGQYALNALGGVGLLHDPTSRQAQLESACGRVLSATSPPVQKLRRSIKQFENICNSPIALTLTPNG